MAVQFFQQANPPQFLNHAAQATVLYVAVPQTKRWFCKGKVQWPVSPPPYVLCMWMTLLAEDKTECAPLPFSRIMFLPPSYTNVLSHLPPPPGPPPPGAHPPPPFPGAPPPPLAPGDQPGLCGLTNDQWHMVLIFSIPREWAKFIPFRRSFSMLIRSGVVCVFCFCSADRPSNCARHLADQRFRNLIALVRGGGSLQIDQDGYVPPSPPQFSIPRIAR